MLVAVAWRYVRWMMTDMTMDFHSHWVVPLAIAPIFTFSWKIPATKMDDEMGVPLWLRKPPFGEFWALTTNGSDSIIKGLTHSSINRKTWMWTDTVKATIAGISIPWCIFFLKIIAPKMREASWLLPRFFNQRNGKNPRNGVAPVSSIATNSLQDPAKAFLQANQEPFPRMLSPRFWRVCPSHPRDFVPPHPVGGWSRNRMGAERIWGIPA